MIKTVRYLVQTRKIEKGVMKRHHAVIDDKTVCGLDIQGMQEQGFLDYDDICPVCLNDAMKNLVGLQVENAHLLELIESVAKEAAIFSSIPIRYARIVSDTTYDMCMKVIGDD